jgi:hypothetical protein
MTKIQERGAAIWTKELSVSRSPNRTDPLPYTKPIGSRELPSPFSIRTTAGVGFLPWYAVIRRRLRLQVRPDQGRIPAAEGGWFAGSTDNGGMKPEG